MTAIGIIDDRDRDRKDIVETINLENQDDGWKVVDNPPLEALVEYPAWIAENKICVLIIDELLDEVPTKGKAVNYKGHDLVDFIRQHLPTLPIFVITAHESDAPIQERFKAVEGIISRREYGRNASNYVPRIIRSAQQYLTMFQKELSQLSVFAQKVATGESITEDEQIRAQAIQTKLDIAYSITPISDVSNWLDEATTIVDKIEALRKEIENKMGKEK